MENANFNKKCEKTDEKTTTFGGKSGRAPTDGKSGKKSGRALFIAACVFFAVAAAVDLYWIVLWSPIVSTLFDSSAEASQALGAIISLIVLLPFWLISCPLISGLAIILLALSIRRYKTPSVVMLSVIAVLFIINAVVFIVLTSAGKSSDGQNLAAACSLLLSPAARLCR